MSQFDDDIIDTDNNSSSGESEPEDGESIRSNESRSSEESANSTDRQFLDSDDENSRVSDIRALARSIGAGLGRNRPEPVRRNHPRIRDDDEDSRQPPPERIHQPNNVATEQPVPLGRVPNKKGRGWCIVINNFIAEDRQKLDSVYNTGLVGARSDRTKCDYLVYQMERGDNGTPHIQAYAHFTAPVTLRSILLSLQRTGGGTVANVRIANGTAAQNRAYCTKQDTRIEGEDSGPFEFGTMPSEAGKRKDLSNLIDLVKAGNKRTKLYDEEPMAMLQYNNGIGQMLKHYAKPRDFKTVVHWYYGAPGSGKTKAAMEHHLSMLGDPLIPADARSSDIYYVKSCDNKWWCGYDQQPIVILDDLRPDSAFSFASLLVLFDQYPLLIEYKGGQIHFRSQVIIVTCPVNPVEFFARLVAAHKVLPEENAMQLYRRINNVKEFIMPEQLPEDVARAQEWVNAILLQNNRVNY